MITVGDVRANLQAVFDDHGFKRFNAAMVGARSQAEKALRAELGANFDEEGCAKCKPGARGAAGLVRMWKKARGVPLAITRQQARCVALASGR